MERKHAEHVCSLQLHGLSDLSTVFRLQGCGMSHAWDQQGEWCSIMALAT